MKNLALVLFCKDEQHYLDEWFDYHSRLGVDQFYLIDNSSSVPLQSNRNDVAIIKWDDQVWGRQCRAYTQILKEFGLQYKWMGFTDTDEFIVPKTTPHLPTFLEGYRAFGGLSIFWRCFGSNGHLTRQPSVLDAYTKRSELEYHGNTHIKQIVQTEFACPIASDNPHVFVYSKKRFSVDENFRKIDHANCYAHTSDKIQLNHYITRSKQDYAEKLKRGMGNRVGALALSFEFFDFNCNAVEDTEILKVRSTWNSNMQ